MVFNAEKRKKNQYKNRKAICFDDTYGKQLDSNDRATSILEYPKDENVVYVEVDGSMIFILKIDRFSGF